MLELKIAFTGVVLVMLAGIAIHSIWSNRPSPWVVWPILTVFFGGLAAAAGGFLWWLWAL